MKNRPLGKDAYGSIPYMLDCWEDQRAKYIDKGQDNILTVNKRNNHDTIWVTEKYDGSNVSIANVEGKIYPLTKTGYLARTSKYKHHLAFARWVELNQHYLKLFIPDGFRLCCEWLLKRHTLEYEFLINTQECSIVAFDLIENESNDRLSYLDFYSLDTWLIPKARLLHCGNSIKPKDLILKLNGDHDHKIQSAPDNKPEGLIYRLERHGKVDFLAKWVRSDFVAGKFL